MQRHTLLLMLLCLLVAATLRLPKLTTFPPGPHYDEAADGILSGDVGLRGARPVFITSYTGKEPLFFYLTGGLMRLVGESLFTLRLNAAFMGLLTVAAAYWAGRELLADRRVALLAAALLAVSFWHVLFSRLGLRSISQPLFQALAVAALFRGLRRQDTRWLLAGGICLGLTAYTYLAARLFPLPLAVAMAPLLLAGRGRGHRLRQVAIFLLVALLVATPLLLYFMRHPETFWVRIGQVAPDAQANLWQSFFRSLGMFFVRGDPYWRFNLPGRPLFSPLWGGLLVVGWLLSLVDGLRRPQAWQRAAGLFLFVLPLVMILPTALATNEIVPSHLRAIGLIPFVFYLPALGLVRLWDWLSRGRASRKITSLACSLVSGLPCPYTSPRPPRPPRLSGGFFVVVLILLVGGWATADAYFRQWATRADVFYESDADLAAVARYLNESDISGRAVYVSALHYRHPTVAFLSEQYDQVKWLPDSRALVLPAEGPALYFYPHNSPAPAWAEAVLPAPEAVPDNPGPDGEPVFSLYAIDDAAAVPLNPATTVEVNFGNAITLLGYETAGAAAGETAQVLLCWQIQGQPPADFIPFVHLEDAWGYRWSQVETAAYPSEQWAVGERIIQEVALPVRPGTPPGAYRLQVGLFNPASGERLPVLDAAGNYAGNTFTIEGMAIVPGRPPEPLPMPPVPLAREVRPGLALLGYERGAEQVAQGDKVFVSLWWHAGQRQPSMITRLELLRPDNTGVILADTRPVHDTLPVSSWPTPVFLIDHQTPTIPADFPPGEYRLHLRLLGEDDETLLTADLGPLVVEATERLFDPPAVPFPLAATFGGEIKLLGYGLEQREESGRYRLTLTWQALVAPSADYTVFVHVLEPSGVCCPWQADAMPKGGTYPTSRWLPGEVVIDEYEIELPAGLPPGDYPLEVGLYIAENGRRLVVEMPGMPTNDAVRLRPLLVEEQ